VHDDILQYPNAKNGIFEDQKMLMSVEVKVDKQLATDTHLLQFEIISEIK